MLGAKDGVEWTCFRVQTPIDVKRELSLAYRLADCYFRLRPARIRRDHFVQSVAVGRELLEVSSNKPSAVVARHITSQSALVARNRD
jgi:hypothetical protein